MSKKKKKRPLLLNLGCNRRAEEGWTNVDIEPFPGVDVVADLTKPWPWADGSVDGIKAADLIEHLVDPIHTMNEAWRVLKNGGRFDILVPSTEGRGAWQDPTHKSFWNENSFNYYRVMWHEGENKWVSHPWRTLYVPHLITAAFDWVDLFTTPDVGGGILYCQATGLARKDAPIFVDIDGTLVPESQANEPIVQTADKSAPSFTKI